MQDKNSRRSNETRSAEMRASLISTARALFAEQGYAATGTPEIVKTAGVTRGALYHHFADKADLFKTVIAYEAEEVAAHIAARTKGVNNAIEGLTEGAAAYFDAIATPGRARLLLIEGPAVLGEDTMAKLDQRTGGHELKAGLQAGIDAGLLKPMPAEAMADLLSAAFDRAALACVAQKDRQAYLNAISLLIDGLKAPGS